MIPALWVFFMVSDASDTSAIFLAAEAMTFTSNGAVFRGLGPCPRWWLRLRVMLTVVVLACLAIPLGA